MSRQSEMYVYLVLYILGQVFHHFWFFWFGYQGLFICHMFWLCVNPLKNWRKGMLWQVLEVNQQCSTNTEPENADETLPVRAWLHHHQCHLTFRSWYLSQESKFTTHLKDIWLLANEWPILHEDACRLFAWIGWSCNWNTTGYRT